MMSENDCRYYYNIKNAYCIDISSKHVVAPKFPPRLLNINDNQAKAYTSYEHEEGKQKLNIWRIVNSNAFIMSGVAARGYAGQRMADTIEETDWTQTQEKDQDHS